MGQQVSTASANPEYTLQVEQYTSVLLSGQLSLDALRRIIRHDTASGWTNTPGGMARRRVLADCNSGIITGYKEMDQVGDRLYGDQWPLPLSFGRQD